MRSLWRLPACQSPAAGRRGWAEVFQGSFVLCWLHSAALWCVFKGSICCFFVCWGPRKAKPDRSPARGCWEAIMRRLHRYSWSDSGRIIWQALETEICTVKLKRWRNPSPKGRLPLRFSHNGVQMLPVLQVIRLDLVDAFAAANLSLEKVDNENQRLFLTSLVSYCVMPASCTSTIYTEGCSFGMWGM